MLPKYQRILSSQLAESFVSQPFKKFKLLKSWDSASDKDQILLKRYLTTALDNSEHDKGDALLIKLLIPELNTHN